jgi:hypothetical protein
MHNRNWPRALMGPIDGSRVAAGGSTSATAKHVQDFLDRTSSTFKGDYRELNSTDCCRLLNLYESNNILLDKAAAANLKLAIINTGTGKNLQRWVALVKPQDLVEVSNTVSRLGASWNQVTPKQRQR